MTLEPNHSNLLLTGAGVSSEIGDTTTAEGFSEMEDTTQPNATTTWVVRPDPDLEDLIPSFMGNRRNDLNDIREALSKKDFEFIRRTAHTLKGICRPYGFEYLETLSKELEVAGEREDTGSIEAVSARMQTYLDNVRIVYDS